MEIVRRDSGRLDDLPESIPPLLRRLYAARNISCTRDLDKSLGVLFPPSLLTGMGQAADLLEEAVRGDRRILIVADFDADGATSCALAVRALRAMGAKHVEYVVPNRFVYGYGLTPEIVAVAADYSPHLLITVDNGISSVAGVQAARARGMKVLITDHHLPGSQLPDADAIVNPNQPDCGFPSKHLAGVGVIFYVLSGLRARLREADWFRRRSIPTPNMAQFLDLVALGTVADVVPLDANNRALVEQGLRRIRAGECSSGIAALVDIAGRDQSRLGASDLAFALGPRLNAAGRLQDMGLGIECLLCDDPGVAQEMARRLDVLNRERRVIEAEMQDQAMADLDRLQLTEANLPFGVCIYDGQWHQGVIGILAGRIRERIHRPVIAFAVDKGGTIKGSARSVPGLHIRDSLDAVAARHPGLITRFGGHAMAAGLTISEHDFEAFSIAFDHEVRNCLSADDLCGRVLSDGELTPGELTLDVAQQLRDAGPWGQGFPEPLFDGVFEVLSHRIVGEKHLKMTLRVPGDRGCIDAIGFNKVPQYRAPDEGTQVHIAYRLDVNEYRGTRNVQLVVEHIEGM